MEKGWLGIGLGTLLVGSVALAPSTASAQQCGTAPVCRAGALPQGIVGGALMGMEVVMLVEGAAGLRNPWIMLGTGALGGIAGGIGGYFLDRYLDDTGGPAQVSTAMLVVGLGLVIPSVIVVMTASAYRPDPRSQQQQDNTPGPSLEEGGNRNEPAPSLPRTTPPPANAPPTALFNVNGRSLGLGLPAVGLVQSYSNDEVRRYGLVQQGELRVPIVSGSF